MIHHLLSLTGKLFGKGKLSILQYHQVLSQPDPLMRGLITADNFEWHMKLISRYFTPLSLSSAIDLLQKNALPANAICVTFDDGYQNNLSVALPILEKYNIPATIFIATGFSEGNTMWNDKVYHLFRDASRASLLLNGQDVELGDYDQRRQLLKELIEQLKYLPIETRNSELKKSMTKIRSNRKKI
ncbi:polysaccharide deacetylase family protein [Pseudobowmanella zhangzhouensis]|uniref:polysaccharide deacetylase family protein n=1 Tax=Pseudobowmanella zhangzhouensis TaxID=1537679 RepID=UPI00361750D5